jgi:NADH:ubiquinone oxidoreductase subunit F (NADH-binding)
VGSGGLVVADEDNPAWSILHRYIFMTFTQQESMRQMCPVPVGTKAMLETLTRNLQRQGEASDLDYWSNWGAHVKQKRPVCFGTDLA